MISAQKIPQTDKKAVTGNVNATSKLLTAKEETWRNVFLQVSMTDLYGNG